MSSLVLPSHQIRRLLSTNSYDDGSKNSWEPFKSRSDFNLDMSLLLLFIVCIIIGAFILNFCINRYLNQSDNHPSSSVEELKLQQIEKSAGPTIEFSSELNLAGTESVCPICLSEFLNGEKIRVLSKCNHGFHVKCIEKWLLSSHTSCPTCRTNCMNSTAENSGEVDSDHHRVDVETGPVAEVPVLSGERQSATTSVE